MTGTVVLLIIGYLFVGLNIYSQVDYGYFMQNGTGLTRIQTCAILLAWPLVIVYLFYKFVTNATEDDYDGQF